jgi:hypothetical protein
MRLPEGEAWARTMAPGFQEVPVIEQEVRSTSGPGMCKDSTDDGRHHWVLDAVCSQSIERLRCKFCGETIYD